MSSNPLLGFADGPITAGAAVDALTSKVGGQAIVYGGVPIGLRCELCGREACRLVCQIYCPVDHLYNRTLYLFCCPAVACHRTSSGWTVLRVQDPVKKCSRESVKPSEPAPQDMAWFTDEANDWGDAANDWGDAANGSGDSAVSANLPGHADFVPATVGMDKKTEDSNLTYLVNSIEGLAVSAENDSWVFDEHYVSVFEESCGLATKREKDRERFLIQQYELKEDKMEKSKGGAGKLNSTAERYEKTCIAHGDKLFYKFTKVLSLNPSQIIRYEYGGTPLLMTALEQQAIPRCESCGAARTFEVQVMPALAQMITVAGVATTLDIGTVIVFSCSKNCWSGKTVLEHVVVQHDPDEQLIDRQLSQPNCSVSQ